MTIIPISILCIIFGYFVFFLTDIFGFLRTTYMHWFATIFLLLPFIYCIYRLKAGSCFKQADGGMPKWKHLVYYLRRDNHVIPLIGERAFPGESFIDVPELGIIEYLGKDCVYTWGDKKIVWGLENVNFTPDPHYFTLTHLLWELGFVDTDHLVRVLNGNDLESMGRIYLKMMVYESNRGTKKLVKEMSCYNGKKIVFKPVKKVLDHDKIADKVDGL